MAPRLIISALLLAVTALAQTTPNLGIRDETPTMKAFTNARIVVSPDQTVENGTLLIKDGRIIAAGPKVDIPLGAAVYDLSGKSIYPGFVDCYTAYGLPEAKRDRSGSPGPVYTAKREGGNAWNAAIHAETDWVDSFKPDSKEAKKLLELGFTAVQSARLDGVFRGQAFAALLGDGLPNDMVISPYGPQFASFRKGKSPQDYPDSEMGAIALMRQTFLDAQWYSQAQSAFAVNRDQEMPEFNRAVAAIAKMSDRLAGEKTPAMIVETDNGLSMLRADRVAKEFSISTALVGNGAEYEQIEQVKATSASIVLPLSFPDKPEIESVGDELDVTLATMRRWEWAPFNAGILEANDIDFALSTFGLEKTDKFTRNLRSAIASGLSEKAALASLTTVPSRLAGVSDLVGTLEAGKLANFQIIEGDIFDEERIVYSVWVAGVATLENISLSQPDFRGYYELTLEGQTIPLKLSGKIDKLKGKLTKDSTEISLDNIQAEMTQLTFTAKLDSLGFAGPARFSGRLSDEKIAGVCVVADGRSFDFSATLSTEPEALGPEDGSDETEKAAERQERLSRLTFPNIGLGVESLPEEQTVLVKNVTLWTCEDDGILENTDLLVENGKFKAFGKDLQAPSGATVIDGTGKHLTPGIIDEHTHIAISGDVNEGTHAVTSEVRIADVINPNDINIYRELAGGTTISQCLHGSANPIGGQAQVIKHRWGVTSAEDLKMADVPPTIKFALGENVKQCNWGDDYTTRYPQSRMGVESIMRDFFQAALEYEADWKKYNALGKKQKARTIAPRRDLLLDALADVINSDMTIHCHSYMQAEVLMLMRLAEDFNFTIGTFTHILEGYKVADEMAAHGAAASTFSDWWAYKFEVYDA
ncbi:MAG: amidohydrolase family protein, partial [candidate division Zixibacteria bacterium]